VLSAKLRAAGLKRIPAFLDDFVTGDVQDMLEQIVDLSKLVEQGNDAIEKELEGTYENVLARKMADPAGMALIKAKIAAL
jgi:hypothetical protein